MIDGTVALASDIWQDGEIIADIWFERENAFNIGYESKRATDYYLRQMNFLGNPVSGINQ